MPRLIIRYVCIICGNEYEKREDAHICEESGQPEFRFNVGDKVPWRISNALSHYEITERFIYPLVGHGSPKHIPMYKAVKVEHDGRRSRESLIGEKKLIKHSTPRS